MFTLPNLSEPIETPLVHLNDSANIFVYICLMFQKIKTAGESYNFHCLRQAVHISTLAISNSKEIVIFLFNKSNKKNMVHIDLLKTEC